MLSILAQVFEALASSLAELNGRGIPAEGVVHSSLGAIAGFCGLVSLLFSAAILPCAVTGIAPFLVVAFCSSVAAAFAWIGIRAGRRASQVTRRHLTWAKLGLGASVVGLALSGVALFVGIVRMSF
jgi:hypothetical protein